MDIEWIDLEESLSRIKKLGYRVELDWLESLTIYWPDHDKSDYNISDVVVVKCGHSYPQDWKLVIFNAIELFNSWYYVEGIKINNLVRERGLVLPTWPNYSSSSITTNDILNIFTSVSIVGDVTEQVKRDINLDSILGEDLDSSWDF